MAKSTEPYILLVEDEPDHVALIEAVFSRGFPEARLCVEATCQGAKNHLRGTWPAYEDDVDYLPIPTLIVLDLWLPGLTDPLEFLEWMTRRQWVATIPVIVFTISDDPEHERRAYALGVRQYLRKPDDYGTLVDAVKEALQRQTETERRDAG